MNRLQQFWDEQAEWSQATFGLDSERGPVGPLKHLAKEAAECMKEPDSLEERADCLFLIFDATRRSGKTLVDLLTEVADLPRHLPYAPLMDHLESLRRMAIHAVDAPFSLELKAEALRYLLAANRWTIMDIDDLIDAAFAKLEKNKRRQWQKPTSDEPVEHVRSAE